MPSQNLNITKTTENDDKGAKKRSGKKGKKSPSVSGVIEDANKNKVQNNNNNSVNELAAKVGKLSLQTNQKIEKTGKRKTTSRKHVFSEEDFPSSCWNRGWIELQK